MSLATLRINKHQGTRGQSRDNKYLTEIHYSETSQIGSSGSKAAVFGQYNLVAGSKWCQCWSAWPICCSLPPNWQPY